MISDNWNYKAHGSKPPVQDACAGQQAQSTDKPYAGQTVTLNGAHPAWAGLGALSNDPSKCLQALAAHNDKAVELLHAATLRVSQLQADMNQLKMHNGKVAIENITLSAELEQIRAKGSDACVNAWNAVFDKCISLDSNFCLGGQTGQQSVLDFINKLYAEACEVKNLRRDRALALSAMEMLRDGL